MKKNYAGRLRDFFSEGLFFGMNACFLDKLRNAQAEEYLRRALASNYSAVGFVAASNGQYRFKSWSNYIVTSSTRWLCARPEGVLLVSSGLGTPFR